MKARKSLVFMCCAFLIIEGCSNLGGQYGGTALYLSVKDQHDMALTNKFEAVGYLLSDNIAAIVRNEGKSSSEIKDILDSKITGYYDSPVVPLREGDNTVTERDYQITVYCGDHFTPLTRISIGKSVSEIDLTCRGTGYLVRMTTAKKSE